MTDIELYNTIIERMLEKKYIRPERNESSSKVKYRFATKGKEYLRDNLNCPYGFLTFSLTEKEIWAHLDLNDFSSFNLGRWYYRAEELYRKALEWIDIAFKLNIMTSTDEYINLEEIIL